ncbi:protein-glutamate methylesterase/protein-glutamine glutaminase [Pseudobacteroides cellulosolvens]|uniref:Protein-glutamate methylesterase/protein-glutamine glutaminase n=1 Tax=Pseudobacteroides cellulosolvens ATCC 35603 = DSM 2933 TaxID=398512 RepID=A0A0L6JLP1_9FIRM|nr:chemotaxis response regulator protein-glutamate methylesterase [Pseudobacteroides cellulosolvens]KNY26297.1 response regulator receiver modulated CheB methylesterase [Pseudobacteroides cellulosolvens ATCC 35603 = DSM 2933]
MERIKVLIVDDSALMRKAIKEIISTDSSLEVIGVARDGEDAILKARELMPDVITMDINMPLMDGLTSMQHILNEFPNVAVIVLSSLSQEGALITFEALELGAFDFVAKPSGTVSSNIYIVGKEIIEKVKAAYKYSRKCSIRGRIERPIIKPNRERPAVSTSSLSKSCASKVVVIGISTGGPNTLMEVLPMIPVDLKAAIIIVQHMPPAFTSTFARRINDASKIDIKEAEVGDKVVNGKGFLAPGGYHLTVRKEGIRLTNTPKTLFMPSVNVTMESVLECYGGKNVIGVLMTGMGDDGADAMVKIRKAGGITIAEDESTAVVFGMPREAIERGGAQIVAPSHRIPNEIIRAVMR